MVPLPIIEINHYSYSIGDKQILNDISLEVAKGEFLSVIGPNGAGKTTLLKCIDRIYRGGKGSIRISGKPIEAYSQKELARLISYVPQADERLFPFTAREFVLMGRYPHLSPFSSIKPEDIQEVNRIMDLTSIREFAHRNVRTLSGGERQKVFIAAALAQGASVLLLDEPTTFLDPKHERDVMQILVRLNRDEDITIVSVTHDVNNAVLSGDRILALKDGSVLFSGHSGELMDNSILKSIFDRDFLLAPHPVTGQRIVLPERTD
ncbi:ABC transporter ATP-binding protein [bacterium]|nr:MAG: ABC transporter ATP-binding protein [bacterium]